MRNGRALREDEKVTIIAMREEGETFADIARAIGRGHTTPQRYLSSVGEHEPHRPPSAETRAQIVEWYGDGRPVAGSPGEAGADLVREPPDPLRRTGGRRAPAGERGDRRARLGRERIDGDLGECEGGERRGEEGDEEPGAPAACGHGTGVYGIR